LDETTKRVIEGLDSPQLRPISLRELEDAEPDLLSVKKQRSTIEYYFTLSPFWPLYLLRSRPEIDRITYVDADMFFFADPTPIFAEMDAASVLVTEHRYPAHLAHHQRYGRFNVGLLSFRNNDTGLACLTWWRDRCLEWCYDRVEAEQYADQKYLDQWPLRYGGQLCVLSRPGVNLAPWNWSQYHYTAQGEQGSTCAPFGAGPLGLGMVAGCRLAGAERIVCIDLSEDRLAMARGQGATDTFVGGEDAVQRILDLTDGFGADYTFEATGNVKVMRQAVESARMGWGLCTIAGVAGRGEMLEVIPRYLITGRRIAGASFGGAKGRDRVPELARAYLDGDLDLEALISARMPLDAVNDFGFVLPQV